MDLSPRGHEQAAALARYLHQKPLSAIYASPMKRVQQTLAPLLVNGAPKPDHPAGLARGGFRGLDRAGLGARCRRSSASAPLPGSNNWNAVAIANAECGETLRERVEPCLRQILADHAGQQVAIFCHGGIIRMLLGILLRWPLSRMAMLRNRICQPHSGRCCGRIKPELQLLNFTPWREMASGKPAPAAATILTCKPGGLSAASMKRTMLWRISVTTTPEAEDAVAELLGGAFRSACLLLHGR